MLHQPNEIVANKYQIITILGKNNRKSTYTGFDLQNLRSVVIIVFSSREVANWKQQKLLLEHEAKIFLSLDYSSLPKYLDYFEVDTDDECRFYLVRELVVGKSLAEIVADGWNPNETKAKELTVQLLNTLNYLHSRPHCILHLNIKPTNIILSDNGRAYLIDFETLPNIFIFHHVSMYEFINSYNNFNVIEHISYKPIEQEHTIGRLVPASDLYSLGYCIIFLLTGKSPSEFPRSPASNKIDLTAHLNVSPGFQQWLSRMVEERTEARFDSAATAIIAIPTESKAENIKLASGKEKKHKIAIDRQPNCSRYRIFLDSYHNSADGLKSCSRIGILALAIAGLFIVPELAGFFGTFVWLFYLASDNNKPQPKKLTLSSSNVVQRYIALEINPQTFCLERTIGISIGGEVKIDRKIGKTSDIRWINNLGEQNDSVIIATKYNNREHQYAFGDRYLNQDEAISIVAEIQKFIKNVS